jgi:hypothetical protein
MEKNPNSIPVRVKIEVEELINEVTDITGLEPATVRNITILLGLQIFCTTYVTQNKPLITLDAQFKELLQFTRKTVRMFSETINERRQLAKVVTHG